MQLRNTLSVIISISSNKFIVLLLLILVNTVALANPAKSVANTNPGSILILGDSISAAYGISRRQGWVALLDEYLKKHYANNSYQVINASISGETSGGALSRLPQLLEQHNPHIVIIELGGNDGLRGFPINTFRNNLENLVKLVQDNNSIALITGMRIPPNYGPRYTQMFYDSYGIIAQKYQLPRVSFLLEDIAQYPELMQKDGIHPTAEAQRKILQNVLPHLKTLLD